MITQLPEPAGIVLDFDDSGSAIVDHACEGPIPSLEQGQTIYTADQMREHGAAEYKRGIEDGEKQHQLQVLAAIYKLGEKS